MPEGNFFHYDQAAVDHLARKDKKLAAAMQAIGPVRREVMPDLFQALMHAITGQQISMAAQRTVWGRLCGLLGEEKAEGAGELYRVLADAAGEEGAWDDG